MFPLCAIRAPCRVLAAALSDLHKKGLNNEWHTKMYTLNPKSVSMGQLYGQVSEGDGRVT